MSRNGSKSYHLPPIRQYFVEGGKKGTPEDQTAFAVESFVVVITFILNIEFELLIRKVNAKTWLNQIITDI